MFDNHRDANGNEILIAAMDDQHLVNTVRMKCRQITQALGSCATIDNPAQAALYGIKSKSPQEAGEAARKIALKLYPYLAEALLRGGEVGAMCADAIRKALGRDKSLVASTTFLPLPEPTTEESF